MVPRMLMLLATLALATTTAPTMTEVIAAAKPSDWRALDPQRTLYVELATGRVVIELAPLFAPKHVDNVKALAREKYFDGIPIIRSHDNYVVQWGDPDGKRPVKNAQRTLPAEFARKASGVSFTKLE